MVSTSFAGTTGLGSGLYLLCISSLHAVRVESENTMREIIFFMMKSIILAERGCYDVARN